MKKQEYISVINTLSTPAAIDLIIDEGIYDDDISIGDLGKMFTAGEERKKHINQLIN